MIGTILNKLKNIRSNAQMGVLVVSMCSLLPNTTPLLAQQYYVGYSIWSPDYTIGIVDIPSCTFTTLLTGSNLRITDLLAIPGGDFYVASTNADGTIATLNRIDHVTGVVTQLAAVSPSIPAGIANGQSLLQYDANTLIWSVRNTYYWFNTTTNALTTLGSFPMFSNGYSMIQYQGDIYQVIADPIGTQPDLYRLEVTPTLSRVLVLNEPAPFRPDIYLGELVETCDNIYGQGGGCVGCSYEFNMENFSANPRCDLYFTNVPVYSNPFNNLFGAMAPIENTTGPHCNCISESGTLNWVTILNASLDLTVCGEQTIVLPHNGNEVLDSDDNLVFLLIDVLNLPGYASYVLDDPSIVEHMYDDNNITFLPGITEPNKFYAIYPYAANGTPDGADLIDPCGDLGYEVIVRWSSGPSVSFEELSTNCSSGCRSIRANFVGNQPFTLTYEVSTDGGPIGTFTQTTNASFVNLNICPPAGYTGPVTVQATSLVDADCTCN